MIELGQAIFHENNIKSYDCQKIVSMFLDSLEFLMIEENIFNNDEKWDDNPFRNTGNVEGFNNGIFEIHAFDWGDEPKFDYNFKYKDFEVSWYKHVDRGMTCNKLLTDEEIKEMIFNCFKSISK